MHILSSITYILHTYSTQRFSLIRLGGFICVWYICHIILKKLVAVRFFFFRNVLHLEGKNFLSDAVSFSVSAQRRSGWVSCISII